MEPVRIAYLGNFEPPHSTENHVAASLEALGHVVCRMQEGHIRAEQVPALVELHGARVFLWTQTYGLAETGGTIEQRRWMVEEIRAMGRAVSVGFHLDRWWGLAREDQVRAEPFFRVDHLFTADGGHDEQWEAAGVRHHWSPPGVFHGECEPGAIDRRFAVDVAFVGNWRGGYHSEWVHRRQLIAHLQRRYRRRLGLWPRTHGIRGEELRNLYASARIVVGDSCLVGGCARYWSDRIPETLGRGGFLLHPHVEGIEEHFTDGKHLRLWPLGDFAELDRLVRYYLQHEDERREIAEEGRRHVLEHHTYRVRLASVLETVLG